MVSYNKVQLMGHLTADPDLRYTAKGSPVCEFSVACNRGMKEKEEVTFIDIVCWARTAETSAQYLAKGRPVFIEGRLTLDRWETKEGQKRSKLRVTAERVIFLGAPKDEAEEPVRAGAAGGNGK